MPEAVMYTATFIFAKGEWDDTMLVVTADHGQSTTLPRSADRKSGSPYA